jgi:membrane-bound lytic murein transglycosylase
VPLLAPPADLAQRRGVYTRQRIDSDPTLPLRPLAFIEDPIDLLLLQIQGSGRMTVKDAAGRPQLLRLAFAGHNDQPFQSVAKRPAGRRCANGRGAIRSASTSCSGTTRAMSSSAKSRCPIPSWARAAARAWR